jgi:hypothetical protein
MAQLYSTCDMIWLSKKEPQPSNIIKPTNVLLKRKKTVEAVNK